MHKIEIKITIAKYKKTRDSWNKAKKNKSLDKSKKGLSVETFVTFFK